jgi:hypothetical protein
MILFSSNLRSLSTIREGGIFTLRESSVVDTRAFLERGRYLVIRLIEFQMLFASGDISSGCVPMTLFGCLTHTSDPSAQGP